MLVQSNRVAPIEADLHAEPKVAVLLNANAKRVNERVIRSVSHVVPEEDLFLSRDFNDAEGIAEQVVARKYQTVFTGGGDGTFMGFLNAIHSELAHRPSTRMPRFGVLKLGTGNSLANLVGASSTRGDGILDDILRARAGEVPSVRRLELLTCEGKLAPFAGLGYDAAILNDYMKVKETVGPLKALAGGAGYFLATAFKTLPHYAMHRKPIQAEIVAEGAAYLLGPDGKPIRTFRAGDVMYRGGVNILCAGTVPCYGFNFKMFPFAGSRRGMMQLRAAGVNATTCAMNLPSLWQGTWRHPDIHDFLVESASVRFEREMPLQIAGDAEGYRKEITFGMAPRSVELVDFTSLN